MRLIFCFIYLDVFIILFGVFSMGIMSALEGYTRGFEIYCLCDMYTFNTFVVLTWSR